MSYLFDEAADESIERLKKKCIDVYRHTRSFSEASETIEKAFTVFKEEITDIPNRVLLQKWREEAYDGKTVQSFDDWRKGRHP